MLIFLKAPILALPISLVKFLVLYFSERMRYVSASLAVYALKIGPICLKLVKASVSLELVAVSELASLLSLSELSLYCESRVMAPSRLTLYKRLDSVRLRLFCVYCGPTVLAKI